MFCVFYGDNWEWPRELTFAGINKATARLGCNTGLTSDGVKGNKLLFTVPPETQQTSRHLEIRVFEISHRVQNSQEGNPSASLRMRQIFNFVHFQLFFKQNNQN